LGKNRRKRDASSFLGLFCCFQFVSVWPFFRLCLCNKVKVVEAAAKIREMQIVKKLQKHVPLSEVSSSPFTLLLLANSSTLSWRAWRRDRALHRTILKELGGGQNNRPNEVTPQDSLVFRPKKGYNPCVFFLSQPYA